MPNNPLTNSVSERICKHMNDDHKEAVIAYARHYAGLKKASNVKMLRISPKEMEIEADGQAICIPFDHKLNGSEDAHQTLVAMMRNIPK